MKALHGNIRSQRLLLTVAFLFICISFSFSQPTLPQRSLTVTATQPIHFGTFCLTGGAGGSVTVGYDGSRTAIGNIVLLPISPIAQPAIFEIKLCEGRNVTITFSATTILTGSDGGSLTLEIGPTEKGLNGGTFATNNDCNFASFFRVARLLVRRVN